MNKKNKNKIPANSGDKIKKNQDYNPKIKLKTN